MAILISIAIFVIGLAILLKGADFFTTGAANIAKAFNISNIVIGMTLVAFATSLPELAVGLTASFSQASGIVLGNVMGSNIANIGLILAVFLFFQEVVFDDKSKKGAVIMLIATFIASAIIIGGISQAEGALLFSMIVLYVVYMIVFERPTAAAIVRFDSTIFKEIILLLIGIAGVILGSRMVVESAVSIAEGFGVTEIVIGVTIIAIGTSLPELTTALTAAKKGYREMAIGNLIGSNLFNLTAVLGLSAIISSVEITSRVKYIDIPFMLFYATLLLAFMHTHKKLPKIWGIFLILPYAVFLLLQTIAL